MLTTISKIPSFAGQRVYLDTETNGFNYMTKAPFLIQFGIKNKVYSALWQPELVEFLKKGLPKAKCIVGHHMKFDMHMMIQGGVPLETIANTSWRCTMVTACLINEHEESFSLDALGLKYCGIGKVSDIYQKLADIFGGMPTRKAQMGNLHRAPIKMVVPYAEQDIEVTKAIDEWQQEEIKRQGIEGIVALEDQVILTLVDIERRGVKIDQDALVKAEISFKKLLDQNNAEIKKIVGEEINTLSTPQMTETFIKLDIPLPKVGGKLTFAKEALLTLEHPIGNLVLNNRMYRKMSDTFVTGMMPHIHTDGRVHTTFNQTRGEGDFGTGTGRLSSSNPNLQQIPKRNTEAATIVRGLFIPPSKKYDWLCFDYSQFEFRIFAHYVRDENVIAKYHNDPNTDFHQACADLTGVARNPFAKQINLGLVFGMGDGKLSKMLNLPYTEKQRYGKNILIPGPEALEIFNKYHTAFPNAKVFLNQASGVARERGYVKSFMGRHIRFPEGKFLHKAGGLVFQSSAADLIKLKMVEVNKELRKTGAELLISVHDELDITCPKEETNMIGKVVKEIMQDIPTLRVPIIVELGIGPNWWESCK